MNLNLKFFTICTIAIVLIYVTYLYTFNSINLYRFSSNDTSSELAESKPSINNDSETNEKEYPVEMQFENWTTYSELGINIKYPNDGTYSIEKFSDNKFTITQGWNGNRFHVEISQLKPPLKTDKEKIINDIAYTIFYRNGMGTGYGYITQQKGQYYRFESVYGPENELFELIMKTVEFE